MAWLAGIFVKKNIKWFALGFAVLAIVAIGYFAVKSYNQTITENAVLDANNKQLEQNIKDKDDFIRKTEELNDLSEQVLATAEAQNTKVIERHTTVENYIDSQPRTTNSEVPDVVKNTIRMLRDE